MPTISEIIMPDFFNAIILFGGGLATLLGLGQLLNPRRNIRSILLFVIFSSMSVFQIQQFFSIVSRGAYINTELHALLMAEFLVGPSMYLFYMSLFNRNFKFSYLTIAHFLPALVAFVLIMILNIHHLVTGRLLARLYGFIVKGEIPYYFHLMGVAMIVGYLLAILSRMEILSVIRNRGNTRARLGVIALTVTVTLFFIIALMIVSLYTHMEIFARFSLTLTSVFIIYWFIMAQIHPDLFYMVPRKGKGPSRKVSDLADADRQRIHREIGLIMNRDRIYCDEDLSLKRLAGMLSVQPHQLSDYLNHDLKINFNTFVNDFRIREAMNLMEEDPDRNLLSIAFSVGFNSKSVFYDAFSRKTGISPARYRKQLLSKKSPD
jgi:AraC-like DNA-binding protein